MNEVIDDLKARARALHRSARRGEPHALERLRVLEALRELSDEELRAEVKRRHALAAIARALGFDGWPHLVATLGATEGDFGTVLVPPHASAHWNIWSASYDEARAIREEHGGFLLAYRRQFLVVDRFYLETLGLDPEDDDFERMGRDWVRPRDTEARARLYGKLFAQRI